LRDDGITYHEYVTELSYLIFLKMAQETGTEDQLLEGYRWPDLVQHSGDDQLRFFRDLLYHLGTHSSGAVRSIFANAATSLHQSRNLNKLVQSIDTLDWYSARREGLGELYEGLLEKNAGEKKSGAGQYFTPRPLIESIVSVVRPQPGERIQDPAAGTAGFLVAADRYIREHTHDLQDLSDEAKRFQQAEAFYGVELVQDTHRLALMNAILHNMQANILLGDTLSPLGASLPEADVILTNPPFGTKMGGGRPTRTDFPFPTGNKQLAFLQHIYLSLNPHGRAAVIVPDNVLFETGIAAQVRHELMDVCRLHTLLRLPTGIFYSQGIKTNVLFFSKGDGDAHSNTTHVWVYDLRGNGVSFGKRNPLNRAVFQDFESRFGDDPYGLSYREDTGPEGRFRCFGREKIAERQDRLDLSWRGNESSDNGSGSEPLASELIVESIHEALSSALVEIEAITEMLRDTSG